MVNCFMLLDPKQTFSLKVVKTYINQQRLSLQAPHSHPLTPEMARTFRDFRRKGTESGVFLKVP
jgi:hypothetical protein